MSKITNVRIVSHVKINRMCMNVCGYSITYDVWQSEILCAEEAYRSIFYSILYVLLEMVRCSSTDLVVLC